MKRTPINKLIGQQIADVCFSHDYTSIVFLDKDDNVLFGVSKDHLWDTDGFYFDTRAINEVKETVQ